MNARVAIVGAGRSGLCLARDLAGYPVDLTIIDRLPAAGGQVPDPGIDEIVDALQGQGVDWKLGTLGVGLNSGVLHTLGVDGGSRLAVDALVLATGTRPLLPAELGLRGERPAGVLPGPVAHHYMDSGVLPGAHPIVTGGGSLGELTVRQLLQSGAKAISWVVERDVTTGHGDRRIRVYRGFAPRRVSGFPRVSTVELTDGHSVIEVAGDALITTEGRVPHRNVEGTGKGLPNVIGCFSTDDPKTLGGARVAAAAARVELERLGLW